MGNLIYFYLIVFLIHFSKRLSYRVNFIFYGISCENYRIELFKLLKCNYAKADKSNNIVKNKNYKLVKVNQFNIEDKTIENSRKLFSVDISLNLLDPVISKSVYNTIESFENVKLSNSKSKNC